MSSKFYLCAKKNFVFRFSKKFSKFTKNPSGVYEPSPDDDGINSSFQREEDKKGIKIEESEFKEYFEDYEQNKEGRERSLNSFMTDYFDIKSKEDLFMRAKSLSKALQKGDLEELVEHDQEDFEREYGKFDFYRENYVSAQSNKKMMINEEAIERDNIDLEFRTSIKERMGIARKLGIEIDEFSNEGDYLFLDKEKEQKKEKISFEELSKRNLYFNEDIAQETEKKKTNSDITGAGDGSSSMSRDSYYKEVDEKRLQRDLETVKMIKHNFEAIENSDPDMYYELKGRVKLSLRAKIQIYKNYLEGWEIREIGAKYGVHPNRVKIIVWQFQNFIEEHLPRLSFSDLIKMVSLENKDNDCVMKVDYGIDMDEIDKEEGGEVFHSFSRPKVGPVPPRQKESSLSQEEIEKIVYKEKDIKEDFIVEGVKGPRSNRYLIKNWVVYKGPGSQEVSPQFKKIIRSTEKRNYLPIKCQINLKYGPRKAASGYKLKSYK